MLRKNLQFVACSKKHYCEYGSRTVDKTATVSNQDEIYVGRQIYASDNPDLTQI